MKRLLVLTLILCALWAVALAYPSLEEIGDYALVNNPNPQDRLHLRTGPGSGYASLGKYYNGTVCEILEVTSRRDWVKVLVYPSEADGWMMTKYLAFGDARNSVTNVQPSAWVTNPRGTNLRTGPSGKSPLIDPVAQGTQTTVLGVVGENWCHVQIENLTGYVMTKDLSSFQAPVGAQGEVAYVHNPRPWQRLNLRTGPGTHYASQGLFCTGTPVKVVERRDDGWVLVSVGSLTGYMDEGFLSDSFLSPSGPEMKVANPIPTHRLNLRESPSVHSASLGRYGNGTWVNILGFLKGEEWAYVQLGDRTGYMMMKYLE